MDVLRVTLDSWRDLVSLTTPEGQTPGDTLSGGVTIDPSLTGPVVDSAGGIHHNTQRVVEVTTLPWSADLLDPTHCQPTAWGYRVTLSVRGAKPITCVLTAERIAATPPVDGVRTMRLEDWAALGGALSPGVVTAGAANEAAEAAAASATAPALGADDNYVTDAEKVKLGNLSGTNTGDQTLPTWTSIAGKPAVVAAGADAAAARAAIGAGTSDLTLGTTASTAKAGNYSPPAASATTQGIVELATIAETTTGTDTARAVTPAGAKALADTKAAASHTHDDRY